MRTALVTLLLGDTYQQRWAAYAEGTWRDYAARHGFDVITLDQPLDRTSRAQSRSPAWQKLLVGSQSFSKRYERLVWVDSDIVINPHSPNVLDGVPMEKVGITDEFASPSRAAYRLARTRMLEHQGLPVTDDAVSSKRFYEDWGLPAPGVEVPQTGVFVFAPTQHSDFLEYVYNSYEDKGPAELNYEMRPLAYELVKRDLAHWLDPRFNALWVYLRLLRDAPAPTLRRRAARRLNLLQDPTEADLCTAAWRENYFLHFAGYATQMRLLEGVNTPTGEARGAM